MSPYTEISVLNQALEPLSRSLTIDEARHIAALKPDTQTLALLDELGRKANEGQLTDDEQALYSAHVRAGNLMTVLQAKARKLLDEFES
ncbi:MAG: hypothetical protein KDA92_14795 [Planctomycetales bacterium]|nr:hypothetical protein [Planctomycetales bacterium]MCA9166709.1 hypothetical protein [Planctomycetales bacterium]